MFKSQILGPFLLGSSLPNFAFNLKKENNKENLKLLGAKNINLRFLPVITDFGWVKDKS